MDTPDVFIVSPVIFDHGEDDPFGFDDLTEKVGAYYVPVSGSVRRIRYFVFIPFVDSVLQELKIGKREKRSVRCRLEKLFVYLAFHKYGLGKNSGLIGNSLEDRVNPFDPSSGSWVKNDCFKIYTRNSLDAIGAKEENFKKLLSYTLKDKHIKFVRDFLSRQGSLDNHKKWLDSQKKSYQGSIFDFSKPLQRNLYNYFLKRLLNNDKTQRLTRNYPNLLNNPGKYIEKIQNDDKRYPFKNLNAFIAKSIKAVNADLLREASGNLWDKAWAHYQTLKEKHNKVILPVMKSSRRTGPWQSVTSKEALVKGLYKAASNNVGDWFSWKNGAFAKGADFKKVSTQWESISDRAAKQYSAFRLRALASIIEDIINKEYIK